MATKPFRSDSGVAMATGTASWQGPTGVGGIYYKTGVGLVMRKTDNTEVTLGAGGGGGTLATTYAAGASTSDSIMTLDSTRGKVVIRDNAAPIGILFEIQANAGTSKWSFDASNMNFGANRGITTTAGIGAFDFSNATGIFKTSTGSHTFGSAAWSVPANLVVTGGSSATNTIGFALAPNVADGASSVAVDINNGTTASNASFKFLRVRNNGTEIGSIRPSALGGGGIRIVPDSTAYLEMSSAGGTFLAYNANSISIGSANISINGSNLLSDGTTTLGQTSNFWPSSFSARPVVKNQVIAAASSVTITPSSGNYARINLSATAISTMTISAGQTDGEQMMVEVVQDGTGSRTIPSTWTNVAFAGGSYTRTATANQRDCLNFVYNSTLAKWVERSRAMAVV